MFLTSLKQICNEYLIKFSENPSAPKLENRENISMFSTCSELTPRAPIPDGRMEQIMQPWMGSYPLDCHDYRTHAVLKGEHEEKLICTEHEEHEHDHEHKHEEHKEKLIHAHIAYVKVAHETIISLLASVFHLRQDLILHWDWTKVSYLILSIME